MAGFENVDTSTLSNVSILGTSFALLAAHPARKSYVVVNDSGVVLYVNEGATASATAFTYKLQPGDILESPYPCFNGAVNGIGASASGTARVTERR